MITVDFEFVCWRDKFRKYRQHLADIQKLEKQIERLLKKREKVPVVKDKVRASSAEFPFIETHVTVDAYDPAQTLTIDRMIQKRQYLINAYQSELLEVDEYILNIPDANTREAFRLVFIEGMTQAKASEIMHFSRNRAGQLIRKEFKRYTKDCAPLCK